MFFRQEETYILTNYSFLLVETDLVETDFFGKDFIPVGRNWFSVQWKLFYFIPYFFPASGNRY